MVVKISVKSVLMTCKIISLPFTLTFTIWWIAWPIPFETWHKYLPEWYENVFWKTRLPLDPTDNISAVKDGGFDSISQKFGNISTNWFVVFWPPVCEVDESKEI